MEKREVVEIAARWWANQLRLPFQGSIPQNKNQERPTDSYNLCLQKALDYAKIDGKQYLRRGISTWLDPDGFKAQNWWDNDEGIITITEMPDKVGWLVKE